MNFFFAGAPQRCFRFQFVSYTLFPVSVLFFSLFLLLTAGIALQTVTAEVMILQLFGIKMLAAELATAIVTSLRPYILRMVAFLPARFAD